MTDYNENIYLRSVRISAFKPFKFEERVEINFPKGPGAIILCGHNGLGKSSTLEAIQWVLTGTTSRIEQSNENNTDQYVSHYSVEGNRTDADASLVFGDGVGGHREFSRTPSVSGSIEDAFSFITSSVSGDADFDPGREFLRRLELTHFLSQRAQARMAEASSDDLYSRLTQVAGLYIYDHASSVILGKGTTRRHRAFVDQIANKSRNRGTLEEAISRFEAKREAASTEGVSPQTYRGLVEAALQEISFRNEDLLLWQFFDTPPGYKLTSSESEGDILSDSMLAAQAIDRWLASFRNQLVKLLNLANQYDYILREIEDAPHSEEFPSVESLSHAQNALQHKVNINLARIEKLELCIGLGKSIQSDTAELRVLRETLRDEIGPAVHSAKLNRDKAQKLDEVLRNLRKSIDRKIAQISGAKLLIQLVNNLQALEREIKTLKNDGDYFKNIGELERQSDASARAFGDAQLELTKARERYSSAEARLGNLKSVVGDLLALVVPDQNNCPFCGHKHESAEEMRHHAEQLLDVEEDGLGELVSAIRMAESKVKAANDGHAKASQRVKAALEVQTQIQQNKEKVNVLKSDIESQNTALSIPAVFHDDYISFISICEQDAAVLNEEFNKQKPSQDAQPLNEAQADFERMQVDAEKTRQKILQAEEALEQDKAKLVQLAGSLGIDATSLSAFIDQHSIAEQAVASLTERQSQLSKLSSFWVKKIAILQEWQAATSPKHYPDIKAINSIQNEFDRRAKLKDKFDSDVEKWRNGVKGYLASAELQQARSVLQKLIGQSDLSDDDLIKAARKEQSDIETRVNCLDTAREIAERISTCMERAGKDARENFFATDFADSLNDHLTALSPHRNLQVKLDPVVTQGGGKRLRLLDRGLQVSNSYSEGELAAVSLAAMLAAARKYRWSRWPALFLDDPIQHEDAIHQAAFADAIRNLIRYADYQVFITTHDRGKAEYLQRKMKSYKLSCEIISYRKEGDRNVIDPSRLVDGEVTAAAIS